MFNGKRYAEVQIEAWHDFGWDGIFVATDSVAIAHSLGLEVLYTELGAAPGPIGMLDSLEEFETLTWPDPRETRLNEWIIATRTLAQEVGDRVLVIGRADQGAFSLAAQVRGMEGWLLEVGYSENPDLLHRILSRCNRYILSFANLLLDAGAHVVTIGDALASGSLISPKTFERYAFPYQQQLAQSIRERGAMFSIHVCGKTNHVIGRLVDTGAHILEFDAPTDFEVAWQAAQGKACLLGNVAVSEVLTLGSPEQVEAECRWRLDKVKPESGYILSSGCALSPNAPAENVRAMVESAKRFGHY
jgi:uroporphyrinogen decarboxylase